MLPQNDSPVFDSGLSQRVYWSALHTDGTPLAELDVYTFLQEPGADLEISQSSRRSTELLANSSNFSLLLSLAFIGDDPTNPSFTARKAFDVFLACINNNKIMDACFESGAVMHDLFSILRACVAESGTGSALQTTLHAYIDGISTFLFTGIKRQERLLKLIGTLAEDDRLLDTWIECSRNHKAQESLLSFFSNYQTRSDNVTDSIGDLCREKDTMRRIIRRMLNIRGRYDPKVDNEISYSHMEAYAYILSHILHYNVPHLCEQILEHYNIILDKYVTFPPDAPGASFVYKICGQVIVYMLRYLTIRSIEIHYQELARLPHLPEDFVENRKEYIDNSISDCFYCTRNKISHPLVPSGVARLDAFEEKYAPTFIDILSKMVGTIASIDRIIASDAGKQGCRSMELAVYSYLLYYAHILGISNSSHIAICLFRDAGDLYDIQLDFLPRKIMEETGLGEFMWSDMSINDLFTLDQTLCYVKDDINAWSLPMFISPLLAYTQIVRQRKVDTILRAMETYKDNTLVQAVGTRILMGIVELGVCLSDRNHSLLENVVASFCRFCLSSGRLEYLLSDLSAQGSGQRTSSYAIAIKSVFRETMRLCTEVSGIMLTAVKYGKLTADMECLDMCDIEDGMAYTIPRTFDRFARMSDLRYNIAHALLCSNTDFSRLAADLIPVSDLCSAERGLC